MRRLLQFSVLLPTLLLATTTLAAPKPDIAGPDESELAGRPVGIAVAPAQDTAGAEPDQGGSRARDVRAEIPQLVYAYFAPGAPKGTFGAQGYGLGLAAPGESLTVGGGATVWGAPIARLTIMADAQRNVWGNFSPSAAVVAHIAGDRRDGWSLGALGKFKIEGFAAGPRRDEIESEVEAGLLGSFQRLGWRLDLNAIGGIGTGDEGEADVEGRLRAGRNLGSLFWLGVDGQIRLRVSGPKYLPNGRTWDFASGPQLLLGSGRFYGALTTGVATMGLQSRSLAYVSIVSAGGAI
jgi:hypothetical protein